MDRAAHECLGIRQSLCFGQATEVAGRIGPQPRRRIGQHDDRAVALGLGDPGDGLHDREGLLIALVEIDHRQAVRC